ncbi:L-lactate dehydrogenase 3 [Spirochaetia bacterium]|nr:L-lactate dehydrogenase 3 [Spirochaetia bacterium]
MSSKRKIAIIGVGHVGSTTAYTVAMQGLVDELVLIDTNEKKAEGEAFDIEDARAGLPVQLKVHINDYAQTTDCEIAVISAGPLPRPDQSRLDTLGDGVKIIDDIVPHLLGNGFKGIIVDISNPCDVMTHYLWKKTGFPVNRVFGTGTGLDSLRLRSIVGKVFTIAPESVEGYVLGEHGDSQIVPWSQVRVRGKTVPELIADNEKYRQIDLTQLASQISYRGWAVLLSKGSTMYGIATATAAIIRAVLNDENRILPVSAALSGEYGQRGLHIGVPAVIGRNGIRDIIELHLNDEEASGFAHSADVIKSYIAKIGV